MLKIIKPIIGVFVFLLMMQNAFGAWIITPVKQYELKPGATCSAWYQAHRNDLGKEYNGSLYSEQYKKFVSLWMKVEGMTADQVNHNGKPILTVPVSGNLARWASFYAITSDTGEIVPDKLVIEGKTYQKSAAEGAETLFTLVKAIEQKAPQVTVIPVITEVPVIKPIVVVPTKEITSDSAIVTTQKKSTNILGYIITGAVTFFLLMAIGFKILGLGKKKQVPVKKQKPIVTPPPEKSPLRTFVITDESLLKAVVEAKILTVKNGNELHFDLLTESDGEKVIFPNNVLVKNVNKNIYRAVKELHATYLQK